MTEMTSVLRTNDKKLVPTVPGRRVRNENEREKVMVRRRVYRPNEGREEV